MVSYNNVIICLYTLTEQHIFRQVSQGRLHYIKVPAAQTVHEGWQEFSSHTRGSKDNGECICTWHFDVINNILACRHLTWGCSGCTAGPDWTPCCGTLLQGNSSTSEDHSDNTWHVGCTCKNLANFFQLCNLVWIVKCTYNKILNDFWISFGFLIHFSQPLKHI